MKEAEMLREYAGVIRQRPNLAFMADDLERASGRLAELEKALGEVRQTHLECKDCWYSCPKSVEGCCNDSVPKDHCNCGADFYNAIIDKALGISSPATTKNTQS